MVRRSPGLRVSFASAAVVLLAFACSFRTSTASRECVGPSCAESAPGDPSTVAPAADGAGGTTVEPQPVSALCGVGSCLPDTPESCEGDPSTIPGFVGAGGTGPDVNLDASVVVSADADAGVELADAGLDGGTDHKPPNNPVVDAGTPPSIAPSSFACRLAAEPMSGVLERTCGLVGTGEVEAPCTSVLDCGPGLACSGGDTGRCLPYCCGGADVCDDGAYCAPRPLRLEGVASSAWPLAPVCVPADGCDLGDPFPCPQDADCGCEANEACTVVRGDGTTSCEEPGDGTDQDPCPCAPGHLCVPATQTCRKFCSLTAPESVCTTGQCQSAPSLPEGWGLCVEG